MLWKTASRIWAGIWKATVRGGGKRLIGGWPSLRPGCANGQFVLVDVNEISSEARAAASVVQQRKQLTALPLDLGEVRRVGEHEVGDAEVLVFPQRTGDVGR